MDRDHLTQVLDRIETAFSRVEAAAAQPRASSPAAALVERNMRLREQLTDALTELDSLIARIEG